MPVRVSPRAILSVAAALLGVVVTAWLVLGGGGASEAAQVAAMTGYWQVTGQVLQAHDSADQSPGEVMARMWSIDGGCGQHGCHLTLSRQIAGMTANESGGVLTAPLIWHAGHWRATFTELDVYCATGDPSVTVPGTELSTWNITLAPAGTITAIEDTTTSAANCLTGTSEIRWRARRATLQQSPVSA